MSVIISPTNITSKRDCLNDERPSSQLPYVIMQLPWQLADDTPEQTTHLQSGDTGVANDKADRSFVEFPLASALGHFYFYCSSLSIR